MSTITSATAASLQARRVADAVGDMRFHVARVWDLFGVEREEALRQQAYVQLAALDVAGFELERIASQLGPHVDP